MVNVWMREYQQCSALGRAGPIRIVASGPEDYWRYRRVVQIAARPMLAYYPPKNSSRAW